MCFLWLANCMRIALTDCSLDIVEPICFTKVWAIAALSLYSTINNEYYCILSVCFLNREVNEGKRSGSPLGVGSPSALDSERYPTVFIIPQLFVIMNW